MHSSASFGSAHAASDLPDGIAGAGSTSDAADAANGTAGGSGTDDWRRDLPVVAFEKYELPNGLRVVLSVDRSAPVVATYIHYHVGSKNERGDRTGFAHFFEHLMFEGTEYIPRHQIDKIVQSAGGRLNAHTSFDFTGYHLLLPANELKLALWIESERLLHAKIEEIGVETQRGVVKEERKTTIDNRPYGSVLENIAANIAADTPYAWTPIGSAQYIDQATIEEFRDFYRSFYVPNNAVLAIVGDIDIARTKQLVAEYFGDIPRGGEIERPRFSLGLGREERTVEIIEEKTPLPALLYVYRGAAQGTPDAYALEYLTMILATGNSSRFYSEMVDRKQLAVSVQAFPLDLENGGMLGLFAVAHPTTTMEQLAAEFDREVRDVIANGVTEEEYQKARNQLETQYARRFNDPLDKAMALASHETFHGDPGLINTEIERYMSVTPEDIRRATETYLATTNRVVLKYLPPVAAAAEA